MRFCTSLCVFLLALVGCRDATTGPSALAVRVARARWDRSGVDSYELTLRRLCFCPSIDPVRVTVEDRVVVSRIVVTTGDPVPAQSAELYPDVEGLFALIDEARAHADDLDVEFDETYGFPTLVSIDWDEVTADEEVTYRVEAFERQE